MDKAVRDGRWLAFDFATAGSRIGTLPALGHWKPLALEVGDIAAAVAESDAEWSQEAGWYRFFALCTLGILSWTILLTVFDSIFAQRAIQIAGIIGPRPALFLLRNRLLVVLTLAYAPMLVLLAADGPRFCRRSVTAPRRLHELRLTIERSGPQAAEELQRVVATGNFPLVARALTRRNPLSRAVSEAEGAILVRVAEQAHPADGQER